MKVPISIGILALVAIILSGCSTKYVSEIPEAVRVGVYATNSALKANRPELAIKYSDPLLRLVPAPVSPIAITGVATPKDDANASAYVQSVDKQQIKDDKDKQDAIKTVKEQQVQIASLQKYKWIVWGVIGIVVISVGLYIAKKLGWLALI